MVAACRRATPPPLTSAATPTDEAIWARPGDIDILHPHRTTDVYSWQVMDQLYDTLLAFDDEGNLRPNLAREWQVSEDGLTVTFWLNEDIRCHDGTDFNADDVAFTMSHALDPERPSLTRPNWGAIANVEVIDPLQVAVQFSEPFGAFLPFMADPFASMVCDTTTEPESDDELEVAVGTGPWQVQRWTPKKELVLKRNPDYVNYGRPVDNPGAPYLERLIIQPMPEALSRLSALRWGDAHVITDLPLDEVERIRQNADVTLHVAENTGQSIFFEFTVVRPPFNDIRARQAIAHAINPEAAIAETFGDLVKREHCPVADGVIGNDPEWCKAHDYDYDPERAQALLAEMGYGPDNLLSINLITWTGDQREELLEVFRDQLATVGIDATFDSMDISTLNARVRLENEQLEGEGTVDLMGWAWYDADILHALWHSPGAYGGYHSPELDALLQQMRRATNSQTRLEAIRAVQAYLLEQAIVIPVYTPGWLWVYASNAHLEGVKIGAFNRPLFNDARWRSPAAP